MQRTSQFLCYLFRSAPLSFFLFNAVLSLFSLSVCLSIAAPHAPLEAALRLAHAFSECGPTNLKLVRKFFLISSSFRSSSASSDFNFFFPSSCLFYFS
jgi:hypothetical protein